MQLVDEGGSPEALAREVYSIKKAVLAAPPPHRAAPWERPQNRRNSRGKLRQRPASDVLRKYRVVYPARRMSGNSGVEEANAYELEAHRIRGGGYCGAGR
jgi:hypothetical protein